MGRAPLINVILWTSFMPLLGGTLRVIWLGISLHIGLTGVTVYSSLHLTLPRGELQLH